MDSDLHTTVLRAPLDAPARPAVSATGDTYSITPTSLYRTRRTP